MHALDVICFGEALVDMLPEVRGRLRDCERFTVHSGGAPANVAVGLARLGRKVAFAGAVGEDEFGHLLARKLAAEGIEAHLRFSTEARTGMWFVALDERGERTFFTPTGATSADKHIRSHDLPDALLSRAKWLHVGSSSHVLPEARGVLLEAIQRARAAGVRVSFDPNLRVHLWRELRDLQALVREAFPFCDVVKLSEDEVELCTGERDPARAAAWLTDQGVKLACITLGSSGARVRRGGEDLVVAAPSVKVVDTTGAGDGFVAGLLADLSTLDLAAMPREALVASVERACRIGSRVCTELGAVAGLPRPGDALPGMA